MPPRHSSFPKVSENPRSKPNLSPTARLEIIAKAKAGSSSTQLAQEYGCNARTVRRTIQHAALYPDGCEGPRSGRSPMLTERQKRVAARQVRKEPGTGYEELADRVAGIGKSNGVAEGITAKPSRTTFYRMLKDAGLVKTRRKRRPRAKAPAQEGNATEV